MPSPFPGMDPYLEGAAWGSFHAEFIGELARQLVPRLRPKYVAHVERRFEPSLPDDLSVTTTPGAEVYPDVSVSHLGGERAPAAHLGLGEPPLLLETVVPEPIPQRSIAIRDRGDRRLVAAIEVLSPTNKRSGRSAYLERRDKFLASPTHLIEVDLLRQGARVPMRGALPAAPYFAFVSRADRRPVTGVWPIGLREALPTIPVPLLSGDADVGLDLQAAFSATYDAFGYDLELDYTRPPEVPLAGEDAAWAEELLKSHGVRRGA